MIRTLKFYMRHQLSPAAIVDNMLYIGQRVTIEDVVEAIGWLVSDTGMEYKWYKAA